MVQNDRYFGFEDTAVFCQSYIHSLFAPGPAPGVEAKAIPPHLGEFIAYALYRTRLPVAITHQALLLLARLKARYPSARGTSTSPHRLFLSSLMLSSKISLDDSFSNASWTIVGQGLFELREVNQMERELFAFLGWNVVVRDEELAQWTKDVVEPYQATRALAAVELAPVSAPVAAAPVASTSTSPTSTSRASMEDRRRRRDTAKAADSRSSSVDSIASTSSAASTSTRSSSCGAARSPSPDELRHRRASDAALAILHGPGAVAGVIGGGAGAARSSRRTRARTPSPYSTSSRPGSHSSSSSSSMLSSPISGATTPGSPGTPCSAGPATPDHKHPAMNWNAYSFPAKAAPEVAFQHAEDSISIASW